jgi:hypothetical protein
MKKLLISVVLSLCFISSGLSYELAFINDLKLVKVTFFPTVKEAWKCKGLPYYTNKPIKVPCNVVIEGEDHGFAYIWAWFKVWVEGKNVMAQDLLQIGTPENFGAITNSDIQLSTFFGNKIKMQYSRYFSMVEGCSGNVVGYGKGFWQITDGAKK